MLETTQHVSEGWYPDPVGRLWLRRWDGMSWTQEIRGATPQSQLEGTVNQVVEQRAFAVAPETGWASIAFALHSALVSREPVTVAIQLSPSSVLVVNTLEHSYRWEGEQQELPQVPQNVSITFASGDLGGVQPGRNLDGLLWRISQQAFRNRLAPWLQENDLYRMLRWPNLTTINPELDDMRQAAMLANGMFTVDELAGFSDRAYHPTRALINALSLMNTLKVAVPRDTGLLGVVQAQSAQAVAQPARPPQKLGLFQRLRNRLGI